MHRGAAAGVVDYVSPCLFAAFALGAAAASPPPPPAAASRRAERGIERAHPWFDDDDLVSEASVAVDLPAGDERFSAEYEPSPRAVELALGAETFWVAYRQRTRRGDGYGSIGLLGNADDDYLLNARLMRVGRPAGERALELGVGVGLYAAFLDDADAKAFALALTGGASYRVPWTYPTTFAAELSFAPDVSTLEDGERIVDVLARSEVELSPYATAFVGLRYVEIELEGGGDRKVDDSVHFGVRLGF